MATFKDRGGRDWEIALDALIILEVREKCDPQFMIDTRESNTYNRLSGDPVALCQVLHVLLGKQVDERKLSTEQFYRDVIGDGDTIQAAQEALLAAILNFTPTRQREVLTAGAAVNSKVREMAHAKAISRINDPALLSQIDELLTKEIDQIVNDLLTGPLSATSSPVLSESDQTG